MTGEKITPGKVAGWFAENASPARAIAGMRKVTGTGTGDILKASFRGGFKPGQAANNAKQTFSEAIMTPKNWGIPSRFDPAKYAPK
ncbi:hypothetical protein E1263_02250 [Kribbella antibiotica]|uniref:Uncharacterized protein n=1 Tax=Kribbella antibiotica TaxID=190195 RepID=A0A4R5A055_9ACTN|nr:hypothetical protein [Kribbella antibiotica]TDD62852.1 hypothetical protein E1263_02250 [Kribbella antibiotica]